LRRKQKGESESRKSFKLLKTTPGVPSADLAADI